jgi:hypothetical protein
MMPMDNGLRGLPQQVNFQQQQQQQLSSPNLSNYTAGSTPTMPNYGNPQAGSLGTKLMANNAPVLIRNKSTSDQYQGMIPVRSFVFALWLALWKLRASLCSRTQAVHPRLP